MMLDWMMTDDYGKLKEEVHQLEKWRHSNLHEVLDIMGREPE